MAIRALPSCGVVLQKRAPQKIAAADKTGDEGVARLLIDLMRRADLGDPAIVHDRDAVRQRQCLGLVVGHVNGGDPDLLLQPTELGPHLLAELGVEIAQRLVEQQQPRLRDQGARQRQPLLLAAAQLRRRTIRECGETHGFERAHHALPQVGIAPALPGSIRSGNAVLSNTDMCGQTA